MSEHENVGAGGHGTPEEMAGITNETESRLMGYVRRSNGGGALKVSIDKQELMKATHYEGKDGRLFVPLIVNLEKAQEIIDGDREVTSVCQIIG